MKKSVFLCSSFAVALFSLPITELTSAQDEKEMALIAGGEFLMGADADVDDNPTHKVYVDSFYMDKFEVTNEQYQKFCEATGRKLPELWGMKAFRCGPEFPDHPVVGVSWQDAIAYAKWRGKRLPTEAEWEYAARGGRVGDDFPHGTDPDPAKMNCNLSEHQGTLAVGSFPQNGFGLYDMAGNVFEWVADRYGADYYGSSPYRNPTGPEKGRFRVIRGGSWHSGTYCNRVCYRNALPPNWVDMAVGFRCARDATDEIDGGIQEINF
jgi:iron(II)-dependent oxidoreductase